MDFERIAGELSGVGFVTVANAFSPALLASLRDDCDDQSTAAFSASGMGRGRDNQQNLSIRGDRIRWLDDDHENDHSYLAVMETLRSRLNERLFLGLLDYESHYAIYPIGARYEKHLDSLTGHKNRLLSTVVYLNQDWTTTDGGELLLYAAANPVAVARILPQAGLMVLFLSQDFPHEVLTATRSRHSIAGWFRGRALSEPGRVSES